MLGKKKVQPKNVYGIPTYTCIKIVRYIIRLYKDYQTSLISIITIPIYTYNTSNIFL